MTWKYDSPPVQESISEFRFDSSSSADLTIPGSFYERVKNRFPKKQVPLTHEIGITETSEGPATQLTTGIRLIRFLTEDEKLLIQIGPDVLSVHRLGHPPHWTVFLDTILWVYGEYSSCLENPSLTNIALRYINYIPIRAKSLQLEEYFTSPPQAPKGLPDSFGLFTKHIDIAYPKQLLRYVFSLMPTDHTDVQNFLLDLSVLVHPHFGVPSDVDVMKDWLIKAHDIIIEAFNFSITEKTKVELFRGVENG